MKPRTSSPISRSVRRCATTADVQAALGTSRQTLIDARAAPRYRGEVEPLDPVAGRIPGALNRPPGLNTDAGGRFKPAAQLRQEYDALLQGRDPATAVMYCGSGVSTMPNAIGYELAGLPAPAVYAGSWSEWCSDPARPVERG
jgi:thiosulfate/3-mercaptopyruvate sulfurtransferase